MRTLIIATGFLLSGACAAAEEDTLVALNTPAVEYGAAETDVGFVVTRSDARWGEPGRSEIHDVRQQGGAWRSQPLALGGNGADSDAVYDAIRDRLCFVSERASAGAAANADIWCASREGDGWAAPYRLPEPINSGAREFSPVFDGAGRLYFASDRSGGFGRGDLYVAQEADGAWSVANLGAPINTAGGEWNVGVSRDGETLIFEASHRPQNRSAAGDLFFSRRAGEGWSAPVALSRLNSDASDLMARWLRDGRILYTSARVGDGDADHFTAMPQSFEPIAPVLSVVSRSTGDVVLLDAETLAERARYTTGGGGPHEIAVTDDGRFAVLPLLGQYPETHAEPVAVRPRFINERSRGLAVLDLATGEHQVRALDACARPHGVAMHAQGRRLWVTCEAEGSVIELAPEDWRVPRTFVTGGGVHKIILAPSGEFLVAANPDLGRVNIISLDSGEVHAIETGAGAEGITLDAAGAKAWVANSGDASFCRIDLASRAIDWCQPTGGSFPIAVALSGEEIWISRLGSSDVGVFSSETGVLIAEFALPSGALNLAVNARDGRIYATLPRLNAVMAIDAETRAIVARAEGIIEGDDLDLIPAQAFAAPPDS